MRPSVARIREDNLKKLVLTIIAVALVLGLSHTIFAAPDFVTVDTYLYSRSDATYGVFDPDKPVNAFSLFFEAGIYEISVFEGAWRSQSFGGVNYTDPADYAWLWSMNIYQDATNSFILGDNNNFSPSASLARTEAAMLGSLTINQPADGNIWFFIDDPDSSRDNVFGTSVTAKVVLVPEPVSSSLFVLGGIVFAGRRYWQKRRRG